jgi:hypothetical protein
MYENIPVLNDRIKACDGITLAYADMIDTDIKVEHRRHLEVTAPMYAHDPDGGSPNRDIDLRPYMVAFPLNDITFFFETLDDAAGFADNLYFLQQQLKKGAASEGAMTALMAGPGAEEFFEYCSRVANRFRKVFSII